MNMRMVMLIMFRNNREAILNFIILNPKYYKIY